MADTNKDLYDKTYTNVKNILDKAPNDIAMRNELLAGMYASLHISSINKYMKQITDMDIGKGSSSGEFSIMAKSIITKILNLYAAYGGDYKEHINEIISGGEGEAIKGTAKVVELKDLFGEDISQKQRSRLESIMLELANSIEPKTKTNALDKIKTFVDELISLNKKYKSSNDTDKISSFYDVKADSYKLKHPFVIGEYEVGKPIFLEDGVLSAAEGSGTWPYNITYANGKLSFEKKNMFGYGGRKSRKASKKSRKSRRKSSRK